LLTTYFYFPLIRSFAAKDEIFCLFEGVLDNLGRLSQQYGLSKGTNEVVLVIEAYKTLRDRAPYPASFMLSQLTGSYAFVLFDKSTNSLLVASVCYLLLGMVILVQDNTISYFLVLGNLFVLSISQDPEGKVPLFWGITADGCVAFSDDIDMLKGSCGKSLAPFPQGNASPSSNVRACLDLYLVCCQPPRHSTFLNL